MDFLEEAYPFKIVGGDTSLFRYGFYSVGEHEIVKIVSVSKIENLDNVYNLGFGNLEKNEDGTDFVNDSSDTNNSDFDRVLKTVFGCIAHYLKRVNGDAKVLFFGNTKHKHDLYKRMISKYIDDLLVHFEVKGGALDGDVGFIEKKQIIKREGKEPRTRIVKEKDPETISKLMEEAELVEIDKVVEPFNADVKDDYQFVLIKIN